MLNKKSIKVLSIVLMVAMLLVVMGSSVFAGSTIPTPTDPNTASINNLVATIFGVIRWGGIIAAVIVAMYVGIKFITASPEGKAEVKKTLGLWVAGIAILLSASAIVTVVANSIQSGTVTTTETPKTSSIVTKIDA